MPSLYLPITHNYHTSYFSLRPRGMRQHQVRCSVQLHGQHAMHTVRKSASLPSTPDGRVDDVSKSDWCLLGMRGGWARSVATVDLLTPPRTTDTVGL